MRKVASGEKAGSGGERERRAGLKLGLYKGEEGFLGATAAGKEEERFLSARADAFAGANAEEKVGPLRSK